MVKVPPDAGVAASQSGTRRDWVRIGLQLVGATMAYESLERPLAHYRRTDFPLHFSTLVVAAGMKV